MNHKVSINGIPLSLVGNNHQEPADKFMGILIDKFVYCKHHFMFIHTKIERSLFIIKQSKHFLPYEGVHALYFSIIDPYFSYGIIICGNARIDVTHKI